VKDRSVDGRRRKRRRDTGFVPVRFSRRRHFRKLERLLGEPPRDDHSPPKLANGGLSVFETEFPSAGCIADGCEVLGYSVRMDLSVFASVASFFVSERVLKPKASLLVILGTVLAYDLTTKTQDVSSLRVYRGT
jgi:hypothetical protein